jgi:hypothetical protein
VVVAATLAAAIGDLHSTKQQQGLLTEKES